MNETVTIHMIEDEEIIRRASEILFTALKRGEALNDPDTAGRYCAAKLHGQEREVFAVLFLDNQNRALAFEELFYGTIDGAEVHPREVVKAALRHNAASVILTHNHPSGNPEPSAADLTLTTRLKSALHLVGVRVMDHFVVAPGALPVSLAARGLI